jgi:hypothetical protein
MSGGITVASITVDVDLAGLGSTTATRACINDYSETVKLIVFCNIYLTLLYCILPRRFCTSTV